MHVEKGLRAVSTIVTIILILIFMIIGGLVSYMWAIAPFYKTAETSLAITNVTFSLNHGDYFDVSVLNPSNSLSDTNLTGILFTVEGDETLINVTSTVPDLPIPLARGSTATIRCNQNWSNATGKAVTVLAQSLNGTAPSTPVVTPFVELDVSAYFNATESVNYFNVSMSNNYLSVANLTLRDILLDLEPVQSLSTDITDMVLAPSEALTVRCYASWEGHSKPLVTVETLEGFAREIRYTLNSSALLTFSAVQFSQTDSEYVNLTLTNSADSATSLDVSNITLSYDNSSTVISGNLSTPQLPYALDRNSNATFICPWNWTDASLRNITVTLSASTLQGFNAQARAVTTPSEVDTRITGVAFDLTNTGQFTVNITNMPYSLQSINVTKIGLTHAGTEDLADINATIAPSEQASIVRIYNWSSNLGDNVTILASISYGGNHTVLQFAFRVPYMQIMNVSYNIAPLNQYANVTIFVSEFSKANATVTQVEIKFANGIVSSFNGTLAVINVGQQSFLILQADWNSYAAQVVTITLQAADGLQVSTTSTVS